MANAAGGLGIHRGEPTASQPTPEWQRLREAACAHNYTPLTIDAAGYTKWWRCSQCERIWPAPPSSVRPL